MGYSKENGVIYRITARDEGLEFIKKFEAGYPYFNIRKYDCMEYIK